MKPFKETRSYRVGVVKDGMSPGSPPEFKKGAISFPAATVKDRWGVTDSAQYCQENPHDLPGGTYTFFEVDDKGEATYHSEGLIEPPRRRGSGLADGETAPPNEVPRGMGSGRVQEMLRDQQAHFGELYNQARSEYREVWEQSNRKDEQIRQLAQQIADMQIEMAEKEQQYKFDLMVAKLEASTKEKIDEVRKIAEKEPPPTLADKIDLAGMIQETLPVAIQALGAWVASRKNGAAPGMPMMPPQRGSFGQPPAGPELADDEEIPGMASVGSPTGQRRQQPPQMEVM